MRIALGSDHAGWKLKQDIKTFLSVAGHTFEDLGCFSEDSCDYPDIGRTVAEAVSGGSFERGILVCHTGNGMCMTANKVPGIRAALCHDPLTAQLAREHNDANILCLGQGFVKDGLVQEMVQLFLTIPFAGERHARRMSKVMELDGHGREASRG